MQQVKYKQKREYVVVPRKVTETADRKIDLADLRKEITRQWRGYDAVEKIRDQRKRQSYTIIRKL